MDQRNDKIKIGFLINTNSNDNIPIKPLERNGIDVISFTLEDIGLSITSQGIEFLVNNQKVHLDGFLTYGYVRPDCYESYLYLLNTLENMNIPKVHSVETEQNFTNKLLQTICFSRKNLSFPLTTLGFSQKSIKILIDKNFQKSGVIKNIKGSNSYNCLEFEDQDCLIESSVNLLSKGDIPLIQSLIKNEDNKNYRVLILNGKCTVITEIGNISRQENNDSNNNSKTNLLLINDLPYIGPLRSVSESAAKTVGCTLISSVDITISWEVGFVVKDVNGWPDLIAFSEATNTDYLQVFSDIFCDYVISLKKEKGTKWSKYRKGIPDMMNKPPEKCDKCSNQYGVVIGINNGVASFLNCDENCYKADFVNFLKEETGLSRDLMSGMKWQCVEYSRRWLIYNKEVTFSSIRMAFNIFDLTYAEDLKTEEPIEFKGFINGSTDSPQFGDLLIFPKSTKAPHGHVAVITGVNEDLGCVEISEQNHEIQVWENPNSYSRKLNLIKEFNKYFIFDMNYSQNEPHDPLEIEKLKSSIIGWKRAVILF